MILVLKNAALEKDKNLWNKIKSKYVYERLHSRKIVLTLFYMVV